MTPPGFILVPREKCPLLPGQCLLTFDDGPAGAVTDELLRVLGSFRVKACFCVVGAEVIARPEQVRAIARGGHLLVNHSFRHRFDDLWRADSFEADLERCDRAVAQAVGEPLGALPWFRPPFGVMTPAVRAVARRRRLLTITHFAFDTWFNAPGTSRPARWIIKDAKRRAGGIYVLHDGLVSSGLSNVVEGMRNRGWVPGAVERILTELSAAGFHFPEPATALAVVP